MPTVSSTILEFYSSLYLPLNLPKGVETLYPFSNKKVWEINEEFYNKYYRDYTTRTFLIGINPGRLGAGITGIPFTDPIRLDSVLNIKNDFDKKAELSSKFIYDVIEAMGGPKTFFSSFYFTSVSPIGFTKNAVNLNYYDEKELENSLKPYIISNLTTQLDSIPSNRNIAFCLGKGKNFNYLVKLNEENGFFKKIIALPHPRWVMQYRLKRKDEFILEYVQKLSEKIRLHE